MEMKYYLRVGHKNNVIDVNNGKNPLPGFTSILIPKRRSFAR